MIGGVRGALPRSAAEKVRWSNLVIGTALAVLTASLALEGAVGGGAGWSAAPALAAIAVAVLHWVVGVARKGLPATVDVAVVVAILLVGSRSPTPLVNDSTVAFAAGAMGLRALYPARLTHALVSYPLAVLMAWALGAGPAALLRPPVAIAAAGVVLTGVVFSLVARSLAEHEGTRAELAEARAEMQRRVEARTEELAEANRTLLAKVREVEMTQSLLRNSEEYFRALIENGTDLLVLLRPDGRIRYHSPSVRRVLGYGAEEIWDRAFPEFVHEEDLPSALDSFNRVLESPGATERRVLRVRARDGSHRQLEVLAQNFLSDAAVAGVVLTARDITDRLAMERVVEAQEAQLRQAQKMEAVGRLAGGVAHDFNNVLTVIGGHAEYMADRLESSHPLHGEAVEIVDAVGRAAGLTRQLLMFSRSEVARPRILDLNASMENVRKLSERLMPEAVTFRARLQSRRWRVMADPGHVEQVVMNLVVNARDAVMDGGTITIETADEEIDTLIRTPMGDIVPGRYVVLTVRDDGCGIPPEIQDRIFDPFFTTKGSGGTGLGLSTVFGIVRDAGAVIGVESRVGEGSAFRIHFPARDEPPEPIGPARPEELAPSVAGETVLYVEDEDRLRALTARVLRDQGYVVLSAPTGPDALRLAEVYREPIDLLLTDVVMPGLTGPELHCALEEKRGRLPVLFVSGYPGEELARRGFQGGGLLPKPYASRDLLRDVRRVLDEG